MTALTATSTRSARRRSRAFRAFLVARTGSIFGDRFAELAIPLLVLSASGSAAAAGLVRAAGLVPAILLAPAVGLMADRASRRRMLVGADLVRAALMTLLVLAVAGTGGHLPLALLVAVALLTGSADLVFIVASGALLPSLVDRRMLVVANARLEAGDAGASVVGPSLAGLVIARLGAAAALLVDALTFLVSAALVAGLPEPPRAPAVPDKPGGGRPGGAELLAGLHEILHTPQQRLVQLGLLALHAVTGAVVLLVITLGQRVLGLDAARIGLVVAAAGIGALAASLLLARAPLEGGPIAPSLGTVLIGAGTALGMLASAPGLAGAFVATLALDGMLAAGFVLAAAVRQTITADHLLGRVTAVGYMLNAGTAAVSALVAGVLVTVVGPRATLTWYAVAVVAAGLAVLLSPHGRQAAARSPREPV